MAKLFALVILAQSIQAQEQDCGNLEDLVAAANAALALVDSTGETFELARKTVTAAQTDSDVTLEQFKVLLELENRASDLYDAAKALKEEAVEALEAYFECDCGGGSGGDGGDGVWVRRLADGRRLASACGDPITSFQGVDTRYWLSMEHFTPMLTQGPFVVSQLAGPANPPPGLEAHKGAWVVATEVDVAGLDKIRIETVDPTTLLAPHPNATVPPATDPDALTTMRLSVGGKQLAAGKHTLSMADATMAVSAKRAPSMRRIGIGWVEQITIKTDGLELRIMSSKANKFADEQQQVLGLHLDVAFLTFDESAVRGALPEMWGLQPMSEDTKLLLDEKNVEN